MRVSRTRAAALLALVLTTVLAGTTSSCASAGSGLPVRSSGTSSAVSSGGSNFTHFRLPLDDNPVDPAAANKCFNDCRSARASGARTLVHCLSGCPGYEEGPGACGAEDMPPNAYCVDEPVKEPQNVAEAIGTVLGLMIGIPLAVLICTQDPKHCKDDD